LTLERAASAGIWNTVDLLARQGVGFVAVIFLARLLTPADFGVFAIAALAVTLATAMICGGFSALIIQRRELAPDDLDRIFAAAIITSLVAGTAIAILGPLLARLYGFGALATIMPAIAIQPAAAATTIVQSSLFTRDLRLAPVAKTGWAANVVAAVAAVVSALCGLGIWAFVIQMLLSTSINSFLIWRVSEWKPRLHVDFWPLGPAMRFVGPISIAQGLHVLYSQGFALIVGKRYSAIDVGLFNRGYGLAHLPHQIFTDLVGRVALPLLSERIDDREAIARGMRRGLEGVMIISTPAFVGLAMLSREVLLVLYGDQWLGAAPVLTILALAGITMPLQSANAHLLVAKGMSKTFLRVEIEKKLVGIVLVIAGSFFGIIGVAWAYFLGNLASLFISTRYADELIGFGLLAQLRHVAGILLAAGAMVLALWGVRAVSDLAPAAHIVASLASGLAAYTLCGLLVNGSAFRRFGIDAWTALRPYG
jgi:teichuronic acid exporter